MKPHMKHAKHVEDPCSRDCLDMISSLPDELLGHMLSSLPTRCAVRTSILSTRWRYLFTLTNCLCFDDAPCNGDSQEIEEAQKIMFQKFVYNVLELHQTSPIKIFSLACRGTYDISDLNAWVSKAVQKGVKELQYQVGQQEDWLSDGLFMCETLVKLKISSYAMYETEIPLSAWLPSLKILHLEYIIFSDFMSLEILFSSCELLEELTMKHCECITTDGESHYVVSSGLLKVLKVKGCRFEFGLLEIDAPNLAYLTYSSSCGVKLVPSWKDSCSFVNAKLTFNYIVGDESCDDSLPYERELLKGAAGRYTVLSLLLDSVQPLLTLADNEQMPDFHRLSKLHLSYCPYDAWTYLTCLLDRSPQLETVVFKEGFHDCEGPAESHSSDPEPHNNDPYLHYYYSMSLSSLSLNPFSCRAKVIVVHKFCGHAGSLILLGHLLRNAPSLQRLIVYMRDTFNADEQLQISKKLLMLPRASTDSCIELK